jgi:saccharopine dehydrogenase (NAD+, L-lysine forming)
VSPETARALIQAGYVIRVERSRERIYNDDEFEAIGAELVPTGSWLNAPRQDIILGLKELPDDDIPFPHTYIHFQHNFKKQVGWERSLSRFARGGGTLYDLEFLTDQNGLRVAAFGYWAGYVSNVHFRPFWPFCNRDKYPQADTYSLDTPMPFFTLVDKGN